MAKGVAANYRKGDCYKAVTRVFIDGFDIRVGADSKWAAKSEIHNLKNAVQSKTKEMSIKNIYPHTLKGELYLWFTLQSSSAVLTPRTMAELERILIAVTEHAHYQWDFSLAASSQISLWKIDCAIDLSGSFLTSPTQDTQDSVKDIVLTSVKSIFSDSKSTANFLSQIPLHDLSVVYASNRHDTCYQYHVKDGHGL